MLKLFRKKPKVDDVVSNTKIVLDVVGGLGSLAHCPPLSAAAALLKVIIETIERTRTNDKDFSQLADEAAKMARSLIAFLDTYLANANDDGPQPSGGVPPQLLENIKAFEQELKVISDFTKDLVKISPIARAVRQASIASDIKDLRSRFLAAGILFDRANSVATWKTVQETRDTVRRIEASQQAARVLTEPSDPILGDIIRHHDYTMKKNTGIEHGWWKFTVLVELKDKDEVGRFRVAKRYFGANALQDLKRDKAALDKVQNPDMAMPLVVSVDAIPMLLILDNTFGNDAFIQDVSTALTAWEENYGHDELAQWFTSMAVMNALGGTVKYFSENSSIPRHKSYRFISLSNLVFDPLSCRFILGAENLDAEAPDDNVAPRAIRIDDYDPATSKEARIPYFRCNETVTSMFELPDELHQEHPLHEAVARDAWSSTSETDKANYETEELLWRSYDRPKPDIDKILKSLFDSNIVARKPIRWIDFGLHWNIGHRKWSLDGPLVNQINVGDIGFFETSGDGNVDDVPTDVWMKAGTIPLPRRHSRLAFNPLLEGSYRTTKSFSTGTGAPPGLQELAPGVLRCSFEGPNRPDTALPHFARVCVKQKLESSPVSGGRNYWKVFLNQVFSIAESQNVMPWHLMLVTEVRRLIYTSCRLTKDHSAIPEQLHLFVYEDLRLSPRWSLHADLSYAPVPILNNEYPDLEYIPDDPVDDIYVEYIQLGRELDFKMAEDGRWEDVDGTRWSFRDNPFLFT